MHWTDDGIVLSARPHGESSVVLQLLTRHRGRHAGLVRGGQGKRARGLYQPGNLVAANWSARLADHLGNYTCELMESHAARVLDEPARLAALSAAAAVSETALPEREPHPACFEGFLALLAALPGDHWAEVYVRWELALLAELGFGLDLESCAARGAPNNHIRNLLFRIWTGHRPSRHQCNAFRCRRLHSWDGKSLPKRRSRAGSRHSL